MVPPSNSYPAPILNLSNQEAWPPYMTPPFWLGALLVPIHSLGPLGFFSSHGPVYSAGPVQSELFQVPLTVLSLIDDATFSSTTPWSDNVFIFIQCQYNLKPAANNSLFHVPEL